MAEEDQTDEPQVEDAPAGVSLGEDETTVEPTGRTLLGLGPAGRDGELAAAGVVSVTGQTVVEIAMVEVTTVVEPSPAGQSVTLAAQLVIVISLVVYTVEVVIRTGVLARGVLAAGVVTGRTDEPGMETEGTTIELEPAGTDE
jgi:hypothetical protein